ncbi:MAG: hypothetical protein ACRDLN_16835 [Solirubrobacteraceae bacterium]
MSGLVPSRGTPAHELRHALAAPGVVGHHGGIAFLVALVGGAMIDEGPRGARAIQLSHRPQVVNRKREQAAAARLGVASTLLPIMRGMVALA